jgi:hypothetical protein
MIYLYVNCTRVVYKSYTADCSLHIKSIKAGFMAGYHMDIAVTTFETINYLFTI